jgi:hypothetical protein
VRVVGNIVVACWCEGAAFGKLRPDITGPVAAECGIEDNLVRREVCRNVTGALEVVGWSLLMRQYAGRSESSFITYTPIRRIWLLVLNVPWNLRAREEPDANEVGGPLRSIDASIVFVESSTIRSIVGVNHAAAIAVNNGTVGGQ